MIKRWMSILWLHLKADAERFWQFLQHVVQHPWDSLLNCLAAIGGLVFAIAGVFWAVLLWIGRRLKRVGQMPFEVELRRLVRAFLITAAVVCAAIFLGIAFLVYYPGTQAPNFQPVDQHVYLSDGLGWSGGQNEPLRQLYYFTPQGTTVKNLPYSWFVALEVPLGKQKFSAPDRMNAYGFLVDPIPTPVNRDNLPVGFTSHFEPLVGQRVLDITCSACHTGELVVNKNGTRYGLRVDGSGAMHAFTTTKPGNFALELLASMTSTYLNPFKFDRFARQVLGSTYPEGYFKLHGDLRRMLSAFLRQASIDNNPFDTLYPTIEGPGRTDALARIGNTVFGTELSSSNYRVGNAPVRYPPLWDIWKFDYVQYNSSVRQPMSRNLGESLGVGAIARLLNPYGSPVAPEDRYVTTSMMSNLNKIETALWSLQPPRWSEDCFGKIDWEKAEKGQTIFAATCAQCHGPFPADDAIKEWKAPLKTAANASQVQADWDRFLTESYPEYANLAYSSADSKPWGKDNPDAFPLWVMHPLTVQDIGTDPRTAVNFVEKQIDLTKLGLSANEVSQTLRSLFQENLRLEIRARAKEMVQQSTDKDVQSAASGIARAMNDAILRGDASQPLSSSEVRALQPAADLIRSKLTIPSVPVSEYLRSQAIALDSRISGGQSQIDTAVESVNLSRANTGVGLSLVGLYMRNRFYKAMDYDQNQIDIMNGFGQIDLPVALAQYKPRPLAGIWAAGPFLHNGSVPTIYQLLLPADRRDTKFWVGTRDFDSTNLGLSTQPIGKGGFQVDTTITGNSNVGHEFRKGYMGWKPGSPPQYGVIGPELTEDQRKEVLEYLKVHRDTHKVQLKPDRSNVREYLEEGVDRTHVCQ